MFYTSPEDKYLNVCVWCRVPPKLDKHEKVIKPGRETLIGHVSIGKFSCDNSACFETACISFQAISVCSRKEKNICLP